MIQIKKATMWKALGGLGLLAVVMLAALLVVPAVAATYDACGDGVCDPNSENTDLCAADCECTDNGVADPGEGCNCRDVVCADEKLRTACGTLCDETGVCPEGLACFRGVCWEDCLCEDICGPEPTCLANGAECTGGAECCSGRCAAPAVLTRETTPAISHCAECIANEGACTSDSDCCSGNCIALNLASAMEVTPVSQYCAPLAPSP